MIGSAEGFFEALDGAWQRSGRTVHDRRRVELPGAGPRPGRRGTVGFWRSAPQIFLERLIEIRRSADSSVRNQVLNPIPPKHASSM